MLSLISIIKTTTHQKLNQFDRCRFLHKKCTGNTFDCVHFTSTQRFLFPLETVYCNRIVDLETSKSLSNIAGRTVNEWYLIHSDCKTVLNNVLRCKYSPLDWFTHLKIVLKAILNIRIDSEYRSYLALSHSHERWAMSDAGTHCVSIDNMSL